MNKASRILPTLFTLLALASCVSSLRVVDEVIDEPGDLSGAVDYCWDDGSLGVIAPGEKDSTEFRKTIRNEINLSLTILGYNKVDECPADMTLGFRVTIRDNVAGYSTDTLYYDENYESPYGIRWRFGGGERTVIVEKATARTEIAFYEEGTLHVGAFDDKNRMSWHVSAQKIINKHHTPSQHKEVLRKTVRAIMRRFPASHSLSNSGMFDQGLLQGNVASSV